MIGPKVIGLLMMIVASLASAEMKIVVLDPARAILGSDQAKVLVEAARKEMQPDQDELNELAEELQAKQKKLQTDLEILSDSEKEKSPKRLKICRLMRSLPLRNSKNTPRIRTKRSCSL